MILEIRFPQHLWSRLVLDCAAVLGSAESAENECQLVQVFRVNDGKYDFFGAWGRDGGILVLEREDAGKEGRREELDVI